MGRRRLFFALWLDQAAAQAAHRAARGIAEQFGGRVMQAETLHLTLAFLGPVDEALLPALQALGESSAAACPRFVLNFDQLGYWRHNHIVQASCRETPAELSALVEQLRGGLDELALPVDARPFFPHLTLLRKVVAASPAPELNPPIVLPANTLQLIESLPAAGTQRYQALACWPLAGAT